MSFSPQTLTGIVIGAAVIAGVTRLILKRRASKGAARGPAWRFGALLALQGLAGALLYLTLFPLETASRPGRLVVATGGDATAPDRQAGDIRVALPEAPSLPGAVRVPDLSTALRRYPQAGRLLIEGHGLLPRDQIILDRPATFQPSSPPAGLIALVAPGPVAPGGRFWTAGQVGTLKTGRVELLDPAGRVVDQSPVTANGLFRLSATARAPGQALFILRLRDSGGKLVEQIAVPIDARAQTPPRVLVLAGAPGPEVKYLRRWAQDAGIDLSVEIDVGAGVQLGDPATPLNATSLATVDLAVIDDRRWESLSASARSALDAAVRDGLGLLLRPTGPLSPATRREWTALGLEISSGDDLLPPDEPSRATGAGQTSPALTRRDLLLPASDAVSMIRDADGVALARWRPRNRGRVGLWIVTDSYVLPLVGEADRYGELWSGLFSALARPGDEAGPRLEGLARVGSRASLCHVTGKAVQIVGPDSPVRSALVDPATGDRACAALWPTREGWTRVREAGGRETAFYVHPATATPSLIASAHREATFALVEAARVETRRAPSRAPGSPWPWAAALLAALGGLWWLERYNRQQGEGQAAGPAPV